MNRKTGKTTASSQPGLANAGDMAGLQGHARNEALAAGFSLIEALIASAVLAIGIMGVVSMVLSASILDLRSHRLSQASLVFEDIVEGMAQKQHDPEQYRNMTAPSGPITRDGMSYGVNCTLNDEMPIAGCREMTCRITWNLNGRTYAARHAYTFALK
jgi:prepilin-type N-terminal cleavage/methylation domain-containing protein